MQNNMQSNIGCVWCQNGRASEKIADSYLYDVKNDKYIPFIDYSKDLCDKFNIKHTPTGNQSYVVDSNKHILYWLEGALNEHAYLNEDAKTSFVMLDIKNLNNIQLVDQIHITLGRYRKDLAPTVFNMYLVENANYIHFISRLEGLSKIEHYLLDIKYKSLSQIDSNVYQSVYNYRMKSDENMNIIHNLNKKQEFKDRLWKTIVKGKLVDVKDKTLHKYFVATVVDVKESMNKNNDVNNTNADSKKSVQKNEDEKDKVIRIKVRYGGFEERYDDWITVTNNSLCTCVGVCKDVEKTDGHNFSFSHTQSLFRGVFKGGSCFVYSRIRGQFINVGRDYGLVMCKNVNHEWTEYKKYNQTIYSDDDICNNVDATNTNPIQSYYKEYCCDIDNTNISTNNDNEDSKEELQMESMYFEWKIDGYIRQHEKIYHFSHNVPSDIYKLISKYCYKPTRIGGLIEKCWTCIANENKAEHENIMIHFKKDELKTFKQIGARKICQIPVMHGGRAILINQDNDIVAFGVHIDRVQMNLQEEIPNYIFKYNIPSNTCIMIGKISAPEQVFPVYSKQTNIVHLFSCSGKKWTVDVSCL